MNYSSLRHSGMASVNEGSHSFTCHPSVHPQAEWAIRAFTPQLQSITALWLGLISLPTEGKRLSFTTHPTSDRPVPTWSVQMALALLTTNLAVTSKRRNVKVKYLHLYFFKRCSRRWVHMNQALKAVMCSQKLCVKHIDIGQPYTGAPTVTVAPMLSDYQFFLSGPPTFRTLSRPILDTQQNPQ